MPIFMKIDGVKGAVQAVGYEEHIALDSIQYGVGRGVSSFTGTSREVSSPSFSEISCSKTLDSASQPIFRNAMFGDAIDEIKIFFVRDKTMGELEAYLTITLQNVLVTNYSISHSSGGDVPSESFSLNFMIHHHEQTWRSDDYSEGGEDESSYDLSQMKPI
ncbi:MAG: Hcp family type VI secretion system effector [Paracoccaceae bacterium]